MSIKYRTVIKEKIGSDLIARTLMSFDETRLCAQVSSGNFVIEKTYDNSKQGRAQLTLFLKRFKK